ncbi:hypothetical protein [Polyangium sp. y55x31]|uniref:hypothetical protein n=1 Tax=Polyangium sp. y55x31 TaxID=3042688 RepID=UPI0024822415|nr:hypothetical protein [Polyangium sp. y55x31]MDI1480416.1 hypothetical protein [Polyangium sp. y55x31]
MNKEAYSIAESVMDRIRLGSDRSHVDYQTLSQEGWVHALQNELEGKIRNFSWSKLDERWARLRELSRWDCNPGDDIDERIHDVAEEPDEPWLSRHLGFDPGTVFQKFGGWPARQGHWAILCTIHDGTLQLRGRRELLIALRRAWRDTPFLVLGLVIRAGMTDEFKEGNAQAGLLGRSAIAQLSQSSVDELHQWLSQVLRRAVQDREEHVESEPWTRDPKNHLIQGSAEILSRLAFRSSDQQLQDLFEQACIMYRATTCQNDVALYRPLEVLLRRVIDAAPGHLLRSWLPILLELPTAGEAGCDGDCGSGWPDPFAEVSPADLPALDAPEVAACVRAVPRLLRLVEEGDVAAQSRATNRLVVLALAGVLAPEQIAKLIDVVLAAPHFPADIYLSAFLMLPHPNSEALRGVIASTLCRSEIDGPTWVGEVLRATKPLALRTNQAFSGWEIAWTPDQACELLGRFIAHRKSRLESAASRGFKMFDHAEFMSSLCRVLSRAIAPFLGAAMAKAGELIRLTVDAMRRDGDRTVAALPALLLCNAVSCDDAAIELQRMLMGTTSHEVFDGVSTLIDWIDLGLAGRLPSPPEWLVDLLSSSCVNVCHPGSVAILDGLSDLFCRKQAVFNERQVGMIVRGLGRIREMVDLKPGKDAGDDELRLGADQRVAILGEASELAAAVEAFFRRADAVMPPEICAWRDYATAHVLPEVRRPWETKEKVIAAAAAR